MGHDRKSRPGEPEAQRQDGGGAPGKRPRVDAAYPALAQAMRAGTGAPTIEDAATAAVEGKGGGAPVDAGVAARVGDHLGADFAGVRVHDTPLAQEASAAMGARAFAYGHDVFLGAGESPTDLGLMAHELTHVAQQGAAGQRAPQRQVAVGAANSPAEAEADQVAGAVQAGGSPRNLLVDDGPVGPGQMLKSTFVAELHAAVTAAAREELGPLQSVIGCPYIDQNFARYGSRPAAEGEALLRRFAPAASSATSAAALIPAVVARLREGVQQWNTTGQVPPDLAGLGGAAPGVAPAAPGASAAPGAGAAPGGAAPAAPAAPGAAALRAPDGRETLASLEHDLGAGQSLDGATASRMSGALGADVSRARIHTGEVAARKASAASALAFTVGEHVVMGAAAPAAGSFEGDALLAHELAHVGQQADAAADPAARTAAIGAEDAAAETHADAATVAALVQRKGGASTGLLEQLAGSFKTGLQLQRCPASDRTAAPREGAPADPQAALRLAATALVDIGGTADAGDRDLVVAELIKLPAAALRALALANKRVVVCRGSVTEIRTDLRGVQPRGWGPGQTWDTVPGLNDPSRNRVIIATRNGRIPPQGDGHDASNLVLHEVGHAVDDAVGGGSNTPEFQAARTADLAALGPYFLQAGTAGLRETYAESMARFYNNDPTDAATYPNLHAYWATDPLTRAMRDRP